MKKLFTLAFCLLLAIPLFAADFDITTNSHQISTTVSDTSTTSGITFALPSRNIIIQNTDLTNAVWVNIDTPSATFNSCNFGVEGCFRMASNSSVTFRNYRQEGVTIIYDNTQGAASWINVIATY